MGQLIAIVRRALRLRGVRWLVVTAIEITRELAALTRRMAMLDPELARAVHVPSAHTSAPAAALGLDPPTPAPAVDLDALPSEATPSERRFLYAFFAHVWCGGANVVEVGPFVGGTTRAIALGMLANPRRSATARLYTYDRFESYYEPAALLDYLAPLFAAGVLGERERADIERAGGFGEVFDAIHRHAPYAHLIERRARPLPDTPEEARTVEGLFALDPGVEVDAIFVDGCKSWYATKHFMRATLAAARPGTHVIFQDYGWYTCFWLPAFVYAMGQALAPVAWVDSTYAFQIVEPAIADELDDRFPDGPEALGRAWFDRAFAELGDAAARREDRRGRIVLALQHAAALAYLGQTEEARERIVAVRRKARLSELRPLIDAALLAPTYRPGGDPVRL